jgi:pimeloyl-ACP methyl ester carboxylesterase
VKRLLAALALPVVALAVVTAAPATAAPETARTITWTPCPADSSVDCGTLTLPINWDRPGDGTFDLALARRKANVPSERVGSLVFDPGGPGGSGVSVLLDNRQLFSQNLKDHFDIVGFDPRGSGRSHAITCDASVLAGSPPGTADTPAAYAAIVAYRKRVEPNCRLRSGPLIDHVDDISVVKDIDAIRAALGEKKLTFWGVSYGTLMGQQYAELFPDRIRALVVDSNLDHSQRTTSFFATEARTAEDSFQEFVKWCGRDATCALHGQDVNALFNRLYAKAQAGTLARPGTTEKITPDDLSFFPITYLYAPEWSRLATDLKALDNGQAAFGPKADAQVPAYQPFAFCADWKFDLPDAASVARQRLVDAKLVPTLRISAFAWGNAITCLGVTRVANAQRPYHVHGTPPILVVNSRHDPVTPYAWAVHVAAEIPSSTLLTYDGWGHGVYLRSQCVVDATDQYLISLTMPAKGTHCPANSLTQQ